MSYGNSRSNSVINNNNAQSEDQQQPKNNNKSLLTSAREKSIDDEFEALFDEAEQDEMDGKIRVLSATKISLISHRE